MESMRETQLKLYVVSCHADKPLKEDIPFSKYEIEIQAGAALTGKRSCEINDHDHFRESISERNARYSEGTAMYWIYRHLDDTPYIGISHYRRRLALSDGEYDKYMTDDVDIITSEKFDLKESIKDNYCRLHYGADWDLFMGILKEKDREDYEFDKEVFESNLIHIGNINVWRRELYKEFCDWAFPILDEFYHRSPEKTDIYQNRDVGFIAERLSHLFVSKKRREGKTVEEVPLKKYNSCEWLTKTACDYNDPDNIFQTCNELYKNHRIKQCMSVIIYSVMKEHLEDERLRKLSMIVAVAFLEKKRLPMTLHEYLPENLRTDLETLIFTWSALEKVIETKLRVKENEGQEVYRDFLKMTHFSETAVEFATKLAFNPNLKIDFVL